MFIPLEQITFRRHATTKLKKVIRTHWRKPKCLSFKNMVNSLAAKIPTSQDPVVEEPVTPHNANLIHVVPINPTYVQSKRVCLI